jgi:predicted DNA-binding WGR domain protein
MPRYIRVTKVREDLFEALLDPPRVYIAQASREVGASAWVMKERFPRHFGFDDPADAHPFYEKKINELPKTYRLIGDETPILDVYRAEKLALRDLLLEDIEAQEERHGGLVALNASGSVYWTRRRLNEFWQLTLEGTTLCICTGRIGTKGRTKRNNHRTPEAAMRSARIAMSTAFETGFGPNPDGARRNQEE